MKKVFLFLATGFEEVEATGTIDVLRRGGIDTTVVSITGNHNVTGAHGLTLTADALFAETNFTDANAFVLPGGMPGSSNLNACEPLKELLLKHFNDNKPVAAICAAPIVFGDLGILNGKRATCYPGFESQLAGATITGEAAVIDGNVITGKGPGLVFDFALAILKVLKGKAIAEEVAGGLLL
jgi:4-methyl-5(b-hydroxyethyl)-thiazole monophosphate biosynthesis